MARSLIIKTLAPGLVERGKIKIGEKGKTITSAKGAAFQPPQKLDHFIITTTQRGADGNFLRDDAAHAELGAEPKRIPVRLLYDDVELNYQSRYVAYDGRTMTRCCDGEVCEMRKPGAPSTEGPCVCAGKEPFADGACKPYSVLSVILDSSAVLGGVWKFRSTSYNTARGLLASMLLIQRVSGGLLAGIPLDLVVGPKQVVNPRDGKQQTIYVVHLEYRGSVDALQQCGYQLALNNASRRAQIEHVEARARAMLTAPDVELDDDETVPEFFPEQAAKAEAPAPNSVPLEIPTVAPRPGTLASVRQPADEPAPHPATPPKRMAALLNADGSTHSEHSSMGSWLDALEAMATTADKTLGSLLLGWNTKVLEKIAVCGVYDERISRIKAAILAAPVADIEDDGSDI